jgi:alginate O-acetyltransferase complex protein AlgI
VLFSSPQFLFAFLPAVIVGAVVTAKLGGKAMAFVWLIAASLFFYAWWNPLYLLLLCASVAGNYLFGRELTRTPSSGLLFVGVTFNLGLIAYFKYAQFLVDAVNNLSGAGFRSGDIVLPLAISFFTFQQIAYLIDVYQGKVRDTDFVHYCLFVTFFPQLIAGPIVHHSEVIPQFLRSAVLRISRANLLAGLTIFVIGLYKKVVIADGVAVYADSLFSAAGAPTFFEAWGGVLAYTFQIYFDFSGYSDMAIGLARVFGVALPINFNSPYKAVSIIDFWRRWHMTLSRFLKDYLYIPLGGSRQGHPRRYVNVMITMLLGGLWHGAAWTFVFWGGLHGVYLVINRAWQVLSARLGRDPARSSPWDRGLSRLLTFLAVVVGWVFFRAETWDRAVTILESMAGLHGVVLTPRLFDSLGDLGLGPLLVEVGLVAGRTPLLDLTILPWLGILLVIVWFAHNTQELTEDIESAFAFESRTPVPTGGGAMALAWDNRWLWLVPFTLGAAVLCALIAIYRGGGMAPFVYMIF